MSDLLDHAESCLCSKTSTSSIRFILEPVEKDLGGFSVRRLLPASEVKSVGPFVFFDHLGPAHFAAGKGIDVRPHPHIGLATITYLFEGEILHRDSLGSVQPIRPGAINWMTAGRGIVHSERTPTKIRSAGQILHALQLWVALPAADEEIDPAFFHYAARDLPKVSETGCSMRVMIGEAFGVRSPVKTYSDTLYVEVRLAAGSAVTLPEHADECALYLISGALRMQDTALSLHTMTVVDRPKGIELVAQEEALFVIIGGTPLGKRTVWWNLVASRKELIEKAKLDWQAGRFPRVPGETEFIPLP
jgi:redox-sensitive bicupin YhaK (pirin superfamily)